MRRGIAMSDETDPKANEGGAAGTPDGHPETAAGDATSAGKPSALSGLWSRLRGHVPLIAAVALAVAASGISVAVVLKAKRFEDLCHILQSAAQDPANLDYYAQANAKLIHAQTFEPGTLTVVYGAGFGAEWQTLRALEPLGVVNRSIPGQSTWQMVLRFETDVLDLEPRRLVLLLPAERPQLPAQQLLHARIMAEIAAEHGIQPLLATVPPVPAELDTIAGGFVGRIQMVNRGLCTLSAAQGWPLIDLHQELVGDDYFLGAQFCAERLWPNAQGYARVTELLNRTLVGAVASPLADGASAVDAAGNGREAASGVRLAER